MFEDYTLSFIQSIVYLVVTLNKYLCFIKYILERITLSNKFMIRLKYSKWIAYNYITRVFW